MIKHLLVSASAALLIGSVLSASPAAAQAKTAKACNEEYKANKPALKAAKEKKGDFITACKALPVGTPTPVGGAAPASAGTAAPAPAAPTRSSTVSGLKTAGACNDEYKANKGALKDAKEKKKDFITACRALPPGTATPIGGGPTAPAAPAPAAPVAPAPAPAPAPVAPAPAPRQAPPPGRSAPSAPTAANQFQTEAQAKARCPAATVVWVNTKSGIYHFAGTKNYGNTKAGAYMCETDATAAGDRASKKEKHP